MASLPAAKCRRNLPRILTAAFQANLCLFSPNFLNFPGIRKAPKKENPFIRAPSHPHAPRTRTTAKKCPLHAARTAEGPTPINRKTDATAEDELPTAGLELPIRMKTNVRAKRTAPAERISTNKTPSIKKEIRTLLPTKTNVRPVVPDGKMKYRKTEKDKITARPNDKIQTRTNFI